MIAWFVLGVIFLGLLVLIARWFADADPRDILKAAKIVGVVVLAALGLFLILSGRLAWALATVPALGVWLFRFYAVARTFRRIFVGMRNWTRATGGAPSGQASSVETGYLRMTLDHDSGDMGGQVVRGAFAGRELATLNETEITTLMAECRAGDADSVQVLEAYLDRMRPGWRETAETGGAAEDGGFTDGPMSREEALRILGLEEDADAAAVKAAHRRLMAGLHPDHGGSTYLAAKINQAKDVLLQAK